MANNCRRKETLIDGTLRYIQMNNRWLQEQSTIVNKMVGRHASLLSANGDAFARLSKDYFDLTTIIQKESPTAMRKYNEDMSRLFGKIGRGFRVGTGKESIPIGGNDLLLNKDWLKEYLIYGTVGGQEDKFVSKGASGLAYFDLAFSKDGNMMEERYDKLVDIITETFEIYNKEGYNNREIARLLNQGDMMKAILVENIPAYKLEMVSSIDVTDLSKLDNFKDVADTIEQNVRIELASKKISATDGQMKRFIDDFTGESLTKDSKMKAIYGFSNELRSVYSSLKYFGGVFTGPIMMAQAFIVGGMNLISRSVGLPTMIRGEGVDFFLREMKVLGQENPFTHTSVWEEMGDTYYGTLINKLLPNMPQMQAVVKGGWQAAFDMVTDNTVKRTAIAQALSKEGWNFKNEAELLKLVKEQQLPRETLDRIAANALMFYTDFRTNSSSLFLSRNSFSRRYAINALQGYMVNRSSEIIRAAHKFSYDLANGKVQTWGDLIDYLDDPVNAELKSIIYAPIYTTKYAFYADKMMNDDDTRENRVKKIMAYSNGLNDFVSSWDANFFGRIFNNLWDYEGAYIEYTDATGEPWTIYGGAEAGVYGVLSSIMSSIWKEGKVLNILVNPVKMLAGDEYDLGHVLDQTGTEIKKVADGLGRFNLLPGIETYGLKKIPQTDDFFSTLLLNIEETNESMKSSSKLKKVEELQKVMESPAKIANTLMYWNVVKWVMGDDVSATELRFDRYQKHATDDPVMKNLYNGVFDKDIFLQMTSQDVYNTYNEVVQLDLTKMSLDENLVQKSLGSNANLANMKVETFLTQLSDKVGAEDLAKYLQNWEPSADKVGMAKMLALSENEIPGASRVLIAYAANKLQDKYVKELNAQKGIDSKSETTLTPEEKTNIQKSVVASSYPYLYIADKSSWYNLIAERAKQLDPKLFGYEGGKTNKSVGSFVNALGLMDTIAYSEGQKGNPNAQYIANVYSMMGKYIQDPKQRLAIMNNTQETIDRLDIDPKQKATIKLGNVLGNVDILDKMLKDKDFIARNKGVVDNSIKILFGSIDKVNKIGMDSLLEDIDSTDGYIANSIKKYNPYYNGTAKSQATQYGKSYSNTSQYAQGNQNALDKVSSKIPSISRNIPSDYKSGQNLKFPYDVEAKYFTPRPSEYVDYLRFYNETKPASAETQGIVSGYVRRTPGDFYDKITTRSTYKTPVMVPVKRYKPKKGKVMWKSAPLNYDQ